MYDTKDGHILSEDLKNIKDYGQNLSPEKKEEFDAIYGSYELDTIHIIHDGENNPSFRKTIEENADIVRQEENSKQPAKDNRPKEEKALDDMIASGSYTPEELDLALDIGIEDEKNRLKNPIANDKNQKSTPSGKQSTPNQTNSGNNITPNALANKKNKIDKRKKYKTRYLEYCFCQISLKNRIPLFYDVKVAKISSVK